MATGTPPFSEDTQGAIFDAILHKTSAAPVRINPDVPPDLDRIITKCLEKDRDLRYQYASEIRADLQRLKRDTDSGRPPVARLRPKTSPLILAGAAIVCFAIIAYLFMRPLPPPRVSGYVQLSNDG